MAQYEHLPIYKKAFDMTVYIENSVRGFSRYHKYTLGTDLRNISRAIVRRIVKANSETNKIVTLQTGRFYEVYSTENKAYTALALQPLKPNRRGATCGVPVHLGERYAKQAARQGTPVVLVRETDRYMGRIKVRLPAVKITALGAALPLSPGQDIAA